MVLSDISLSTKKSSDAYNYNHLNESFMSSDISLCLFNIQGRSVQYRTGHYLWYCSQLLNLRDRFPVVLFFFII